jgi:hypothetical protein
MGQTFSVDVVQAARKHISLLQAVRSRPDLTQAGPVLTAAVGHYAAFVNETARLKRVPYEAPLEVLWIWHIHLLHPHNYRADYIRAFGYILGMGGSVDWVPNPAAQSFPEDQGPAPCGVFVPSMDLAAGAIRQRAFIEKACRFFEASDEQLAVFVEQYKKFLMLMAKYPDICMVLPFLLLFVGLLMCSRCRPSPSISFGIRT